MKDGHKELEKMANGYLTLLKDNGEEDALIAYGTVVHDIKEVSKSYKEAKLALDVGKIFFEREKCYCLQCAWNRKIDLSACRFHSVRCSSVRFLRGNRQMTSTKRH